MAYRVLEVTIQSAKGLKRVNLISRMEVYAVVTISGDPLTRQCTPPDPYGGRHPCWNSTFRFHVPPAAAVATGCLHVLLRTERALGDRDVGEVIVPLADILGACEADPGPRAQQLVSYQVRKVHRGELRGTLNVSYRLGPVVAPQQAPPPPQPLDGHHILPYPVPRQFYHPLPYTYQLPPTTLAPQTPPVHVAAGGHGPVPTSAAPVNGYSNNPAAYPHAATGYPAPSPAKGKSDYKVDFGVGLGAGLVSGAIGGMLASDMMAEAAAYSYGYRAGLADGGAAMYKNSRVPTKVQDRVSSNPTMV